MYLTNHITGSIQSVKPEVYYDTYNKHVLVRWSLFSCSYLGHLPKMSSETTQVLLAVEAEAYVERLSKYKLRDVGSPE